MGINDLSTTTNGGPPLNGHSLANWASEKLKYYCSKYTNTTFIVNSVLHTRHQWLNSEAVTFNWLMYRLAQTIPNLEFFDSNAALTRDSISSRIDHVLDRSDPRGTHLTLAAKRLVSSQLVLACELTADHLSGRLRTNNRNTNSSYRNWTWPCREAFSTSRI